jgi:7-cyano-7-deazaguanine synthase in queuosine biosynthesis
MVLIENKYGSTSFPALSPAEVMCSGGADSTMIAYLLLENLESEQRKHITLTFLENANSKFESYLLVIGYLSAKFDVNLKVSTLARVGTGHALRPELMEYFRSKDRSLYSGTTKNPPVHVDGLAPDRPSYNITPNLYTPFLQLDKRFTIQLYRDKNLLDLLDLTYTCTQDINIPCNNCFACNERNWGIKETE